MTCTPLNPLLLYLQFVGVIAKTCFISYDHGLNVENEGENAE